MPSPNLFVGAPECGPSRDLICEPGLRAVQVGQRRRLKRHCSELEKRVGYAESELAVEHRPAWWSGAACEVRAIDPLDDEKRRSKNFRVVAPGHES